VAGNTLFVGVMVVLITLLLAVPAGYSLAGSPDARRAARDRHLPDLSRPPTVLFIPMSRIVSALGLQDSLWSLILVYPSFHRPVLHVVDDGLLQGPARRSGGGGHDRRPVAIRRLLQGDPPGVGGRAVDGGDLHLTLSCRSSVYGLTFMTASEQVHHQRGRADLPRARRRIFLGIADGGVLHRQRADSPILYNLFVDRFISDSPPERQRLKGVTRAAFTLAVRPVAGTGLRCPSTAFGSSPQDLVLEHPAMMSPIAPL